MPGNQVSPTNPFTRFEIEDVEGSIPARFERMVEMFSDRIAVKTNRHDLTYTELNEIANRVSRIVLHACGEEQKPVALLFDQNATSVASILGVLKAGHFYVPLDPTNPPARNAAILKDAGATLLLTDNQNVTAARELGQGSLEVVNCEELDPDIDARNLGLSITPDHIAWLMYTSGSTGQPKGVFQNHRNVLHFIMNYTNSIHICPEDRLSLFRYVSFVGATRDILAALLNGAAVHAFDVRAEGVGPLSQWLIQEEITVCFFGAPLFRTFLDTLNGSEKFSALRLIRLGSDSVRKHDVERFQKYFSSKCILVNGLSTTETRTVCKFFIDKKTRITTSTVPVGYTLDDMEVRLIDENGKKVEPGTVGEIAVRSRYLTLGYWNQPELTNSVFLDDPNGGNKRIYRTGDLGRMSSDGLLEHLGRKDFQVKIRGMRVEISEIESALLGMKEIQDAAVIVRRDSHGIQALVAYLVSKTQCVPTVSAIQRTLIKTLPRYMIPSAYVMLETIPMNLNGKVDRKALPDPGNSRPNLDVPFAAAQSSLEEELNQIWSDVLGVQIVGVNDPFLELGGDSLRATQLISRVIEKFQVEVPMQTLLEAPTVAEMAEAILHHKTHQIGPEEMGRLLDDLENSSKKN